MTWKHLAILFSIVTFILFIQKELIQNSIPESKKQTTEWILSNLKESMLDGVKIVGTPGILKCKYGNAVTFNGSGDAIFIESMPLAGLKQFTIEVIFQPGSGGNFEQRFFHFGNIQEDRVLLELRSTKTNWYFDAFIKAEDQNCTLIDAGLLHPLDQWYHVAYVVDNGKIETYINSEKELEGQIIMNPVKGDITSIGARQNEVSWFKGAIYKIRITSKALKPANFMPY